MPPNETTVLLTNYREKRALTAGRNHYGCSNAASDMSESNGHVVHVSKDPAEYEPIFSLDEYPSSLTLAELLPFQDDPWWRRLRLILFVAFWIMLSMIFISACLLSYWEYDQVSCQIVDPNLITSASLLTSPTVPTASLSVTMMATASAVPSKLVIMP
uniref:Solute carrier family 3 member 2 N-terminal domain-containing protein n=1 Tax=Stomoxys calcitrans TaxID=35570 RepID=A0A1I8Q775_STOCA